MGCVVILDRVNVAHARRIDGETKPENIERIARLLAYDVACDEGELIRVGISNVDDDDAGFARLRPWNGIENGGVSELYTFKHEESRVEHG